MFGYVSIVETLFHRRVRGMRGGKIIVVEDDADLRDQVVTYLSMSGFDTVGAGSAAELYRRMAVEQFTILVLDLRLPDEDGLSITAHVRSRANLGIIMVTARGDVEDRVRGHEAGADIYLAKPVDLRELVAAVKSLERRLKPAEEPRPSTISPHWRLDRESFSLIAPNGRGVPLTANEVALLSRLSSPCGVTVPRGDLLATLGHDPDDPSNRNLDAALRRLRLKVEREAGLSLPIRTVHSIGYLIFEAMI